MSIMSTMRFIALAAAGVAAMSSCGNRTVGDPGEGASPAAGGSSSGVASQELQGRVEGKLIPEDALAEPWRLSEKPNNEFRRTICGVDNEPEEPQAATARKFAQGSLGPFVQQKIRLHRDGVAEQVVASLRDALKSCAAYESTTTGEKFTIEKVDFEGIPENAVALRIVPQDPEGLTNDVAYIADGNFLISIISLSLAPPPDPAVLGQAIAQIPGTS